MPRKSKKSKLEVCYKKGDAWVHNFITSILQVETGLELRYFDGTRERVIDTIMPSQLYFVHILE